MHGAATAPMCMLQHMHAEDAPECTQTFPFPYVFVYLCKKKCRKAYWFHLRIHAKPAQSTGHVSVHALGGDPVRGGKASQ